VWFAESSGNAIGRVVPSTGKITMFPIAPAPCTPAPLVLGNDGNLWFACLADQPNLGSITPGGTIATYPLGGAFNFNETEQFCSRGPDGEPWCASGNDNIVFRINTAAKTVTTFTPPLSAGARPDALTAGPDGNVWVDTVGGDIDVLIPDPLTVKPDALSFPAAGRTRTLTVSETGKTHWTAASGNPAIATVDPGGASSTFTVTSTGADTCYITISDGAGNKVSVKVTVA
jgi:streptogramin lyase